MKDGFSELRNAAGQAFGELGVLPTAESFRKALERLDIRLRDPGLDAQVLASGNWVASPWDFNSRRYLVLSKDGTGKLVYGYGQTIHVKIMCCWEVPIAGRLRLTYLESPGEKYAPGFRPMEGNQVAELGCRLVEGEVSGSHSTDTHTFLVDVGTFQRAMAAGTPVPLRCPTRLL